MEIVFELPVDLPRVRHSPSTQAVYELLKTAIMAGELAPNSKLPPTRWAGRHFRLSRNTIVSIYERLASEGLVVSRRGSGTYVAAIRRRSNPEPSRKQSVDAAAFVRPEWRDGSIRRNMWFHSEQSLRDPSPNQLELRPGLVDLALFPFDEFRRCMVKTLRRMERSPPGPGCPQPYQGDFRLREAIADHVALMRSLVCEPDDIVVTSGTQQAFDLVSRVFVEPHRTLVALEDPCYPPLVATLKAAGALICPVPVDSEGIVVEQIPSEAKLIFACPSNQFPLGITMSAKRRRKLHEFARQRRALIVEDDYDGEFRTKGEPLKAIYSQEPTDLVFYIGSFSKCMFPGMRLGYVIAPRWAIDPLVLAKNCTDLHSSSVMQAAAASFISEGHLSAHVAKMRATYRGRITALLEALWTKFGERLRPIAPNYGTHVSAEGDPAVDWDAVAAKAQANGVQLHSLSRYYLGDGRPGLLFAVGTESEARLRLAVERLASLVR
ncbi:MAG TPA: PLP-dependent aminotransferase family protein [Sphingomicrobium sp.]